jgi:FPC/CPF motif-containing protein YcgG
MTQPIVGNLVEQSTLDARVESGAAPDWVARHWRTFEASLTGGDDGSPARRGGEDTGSPARRGGKDDGEPFPCYFGADSVRQGEPLYTAVPSTTDPDALFQLGETLLEYLDRYEDLPARSSLVTFFKPPDEDLTEAEYHETLWNVLQFLHVHDPEPWPEDIPTDPDDERWEFCFGGDAMFPTCRAPFYDDRRSRYCPVGLEITFQPRRLFRRVSVTAETEQGQQAREVIQERLENYDGVPPHPDLGDWGVDGDREWPQYLFESDPEQSPDEPPIEVTREHPKADRLIGAD